MISREQLVNDREAWNRKYDREQKQAKWEFAVNSYGRMVKTLECGIKLNHQRSIDYARKTMDELEQKFPQLKKIFEK